MQSTNYAGKEFVRQVKKPDIKNLNDNINRLNAELKNKDLSFDEYKKITNSIDNMNKRNSKIRTRITWFRKKN